MSPLHDHRSWGVPPWQIDFHPPAQLLPPSVDFAIVGAGFTGLAAAAWLRLHAPDKSVAVLEAGRIGAGASGRTGGMALSGAAPDEDLAGLGDVLAGLQHILSTLGIDCDLALPGAYEVSHHKGRAKSPIEWHDSGTLRVATDVSGGTLDPGKLVAGLARAAHRLGATIAEHHAVNRVEWPAETGGSARLHFSDGELRAGKILFANNAVSVSICGLEGKTYPKLTLAARTAPHTEAQLEEIGLGERKPFYTIDLPYLWGRVCMDNSIVWGAGLVDPPESGNLEDVDIAIGKPARMFATFEQRVRRLHLALKDCEFTHRWGGPILFRENWTPVFSRHPASPCGIVLGAYAGHGVALSSYLGAWAAEALLGRRNLPNWGRIE
jgi:glycine/D-amino acid oxidase-like deaminating enzyme